MKSHVLIVDDDEMIQMMVAFLSKDGLNLRATQVATAQEMNTVLKNDQVDLIVLDLNLPDEDGLVLARQIKRYRDVPILVLTGDEKKETLIAALELGVDDFVRKPFDPYELQLRMRNLISRRRREGARPLMHKSKIHQIEFGSLRLDLEARSLIDQTRGEISLTYNEFNILSALARVLDRPLSRAALLDCLSQGDEAPSERAIDVYIRQLRKKIETVPENPQLLLSIRGHGYKLVSHNRVR